MFDLATLQLIKKIDVGKGPDGIYYDPGTKRVFTNNHGTHDITAIDAEKGEVVGTVKMEGDGEQAVIGSDGMIYVNSEEAGEVVVFDPKSLEVKHRFPIGVAKTPTGLAYDAKTKRLFIGCREEPKMVVMDATNGKVITSFPIGKGVDYAGFDPGSGLIFFSCGEGILNIFHEKSADVYEDAGPVKTQPSAKTMAFDPKTKKIFLPAAEYVETPPAEPGKRPTRTMKPGSFTVNSSRIVDQILVRSPCELNDFLYMSDPGLRETLHPGLYSPASRAGFCCANHPHNTQLNLSPRSRTHDPPRLRT